MFDRDCQQSHFCNCFVVFFGGAWLCSSFGSVLGLHISLCGSPVVEIRTKSLHVTELLFSIHDTVSVSPSAGYSTHNEPFVESSKLVSAVELRPDAKQKVMRLVGETVPRRITVNKVFWTCQTLLRISTDSRLACIESATLACEVIIMATVDSLGFGVERLLIGLLVAMRCASDSSLPIAVDSLTRSVIALAKQHFDLVVQAVLNSPQPLSLEARTIVDALALDGDGAHISRLVVVLLEEAATTDDFASDDNVGLLSADRSLMALSVLEVVLHAETSTPYTQLNYGTILSTLVCLLAHAHSQSSQSDERLSSIVECIKAFFLSTSVDSSLISVIECSNQWNELLLPVDYLAALSTIISEVCTSHPEHSKEIFDRLRRDLPKRSHNAACITALACEYVLHTGCDTKLLRDVLDVLEASVNDSDCYTCVYALRGLGNYSALRSHDSAHLNGVVKALVAAVSEAVYDEVVANLLPI